MSQCPSRIRRSSARTSCGSRAIASPASRWNRSPPTSASTRSRCRSGCAAGDTDEDGTKLATASGESAELREARKRIRLLEQENEVLRRAAAYLSQANLPSK